MLAVLDNLERATAAAEKAGETGPLVQGVAIVENQFLELLPSWCDAHGRSRQAVRAQPPPALIEQPAAEHPPQTVLSVLTPGYTLYDRVLRPAHVVVSVPPAGNA